MSKTTTTDQTLETTLEELQTLEEVPSDVPSDDSTSDVTIASLQAELVILQKKYTESELTCKRAQSDYFRQKMEFDGLVARREEEKKSEKIDAVISLSQKIIPGLANLQVSLAHIPADLLDNKRVEGIKMTADKQLKDIQDLGIIIEIPTIGADIDFIKHIPVGTEPVSDEAQKGKITKVLDNVYMYSKDGVEKVVLAGKVIVGN